MVQAVSRRPLTEEGGLISGHPVWDFWWIKWHWDRVSSECFGFPPSLIFRQSSVSMHSSITDTMWEKLTHWLTKWGWVLLDNLSPWLVKQFPLFCGTQSSITIVTRVHLLFLFWAVSIQSMPHCLKTYSNIIHPSTPRYFKWSYFLRLPHQILICTYPFLNYTHARTHTNTHAHTHTHKTKISTTLFLIQKKGCLNKSQ
jgi:hypothetical protein